MAFRAPSVIEGIDPKPARQIRDSLRSIQHALDALNKRDRLTEQLKSDYAAREGDWVRCFPPAGGMTILLPEPRAQNATARVRLLIENVQSGGGVTVRAVTGTVNGLDSVTFTSVGLVELVSGGPAGWVTASAPGSTGSTTTGATGTMPQLTSALALPGPPRPLVPGPPGATGPSGITGGSPLFWEDHFECFAQATPLTVTTTAGFFNTGRGGWGTIAAVSNGSVAFQTGEAGHPGILRMTTGATNNSIVRVYKGNLQTSRWITGTDFRKVECRFRLNSTSNSQLYIGVLDAAAGNTQVLLYYSAGVLSNNFGAYCQKAGTDTGTNNSTGVAADTNWHRFTITQTSSGVMMYQIDNVTTNVYTSNIPTTETMNFTIDLYTNSGGAKTCDIDYAGCESMPL